MMPALPSFLPHPTPPPLHHRCTSSSSPSHLNSTQPPQPRVPTTIFPHSTSAFKITFNTNNQQDLFGEVKTWYGRRLPLIQTKLTVPEEPSVLLPSSSLRRAICATNIHSWVRISSDPTSQCNAHATTSIGNHRIDFISHPPSLRPKRALSSAKGQKTQSRDRDSRA